MGSYKVYTDIWASGTIEATSGLIYAGEDTDIRYALSGYLVPSGNYTTLETANVNYSASGHQIDSHSDYTLLGTTASGQVLSWNGTAWTPAEVAGVTPDSIDTLTDTDIGTKTSGEMLSWNGTDWINAFTNPSGYQVPSGDYLTNAEADAQYDALGAAAALTHDGFADFLTDEHVAHSTISVTAGTNLTGGGTIDGNVTVNANMSNIQASGNYPSIPQGYTLYGSSGYLVPSGDYATVGQGHELWQASGFLSVGISGGSTNTEISELRFLGGQVTSLGNTAFISGAAGGGGVTDHGTLTGLSDNDHTQYLLVSDAATNYATSGHQIDSHTDFTPTGIRTSGHLLSWNGTAWVNASRYLQPSGYQVPSGNYATVEQGHILWQASGSYEASGTADAVRAGHESLYNHVSFLSDATAFATSGHYIESHSDCNFTGASLLSGHLLAYNGSNWINSEGMPKRTLIDIDGQTNGISEFTSVGGNFTHTASGAMASTTSGYMANGEGTTGADYGLINFNRVKNPDFGFRYYFSIPSGNIGLNANGVNAVYLKDSSTGENSIRCTFKYDTTGELPKLVVQTWNNALAPINIANPVSFKWDREHFVEVFIHKHASAGYGVAYLDDIKVGTSINIANDTVDYPNQLMIGPSTNFATHDITYWDEIILREGAEYIGPKAFQTAIPTNTLSSGHILTWNGSAWTAGDAAAGGHTTLEAHTDTVITSATSGQILTHDGNNWVNSSPRYLHSVTFSFGTAKSADGTVNIHHGIGYNAAYDQGWTVPANGCLIANALNVDVTLVGTAIDFEVWLNNARQDSLTISHTTTGFKNDTQAIEVDTIPVSAGDIIAYKYNESGSGSAIDIFAQVIMLLELPT